MPAIYLFDRRTIFGGDDLQPASLVAVTLRTIQLLLLNGMIIIWIIQESIRSGGLISFLLYGDPPPATSTSTSSTGDDNNNNNNNNDNNHCRVSYFFGIFLTLYCCISLLLGICTLLLDSNIATVSGIGTPVTDTHERTQKLVPLLECRLVPINIIQSLVCILGIVTIISAPTYYKCRRGSSSGGGDNDDYYHTDDDLDYADRYERWLLADDNDDSEDDDSSSSSGSAFLNYIVMVFRRLWSRLHLGWISLSLLLLTQWTEVIVTWIFLWHLYRQPPQLVSVDGQDNNIRTTDQTILRPTMGSSDSSIRFTTNHHHNHELVEQMWADRCSTACHALSVASCFLFGGRDLVRGGAAGGGGGGIGTRGSAATDFGDVARALADFFETGGVLDVVPSDIVTGLLVLQHVQRHRIYEARKNVLTGISRVNSIVARQHRQQQEQLLLDQQQQSQRGSHMPQQQQQQRHHTTTDPAMVEASLAKGGGIIPEEKRSSSSSLSSPPTTTATIISRTTPSKKVNSGISIINQQQQPAISRISDDDLLVPINNNNQNSSSMISLSNASTSSNNSSSSNTSLYQLQPDGTYQRQIRKLLNRTDFNDLSCLEEGARYAKYALAIYTWVLYLYVHPITGPTRLMLKSLLDGSCNACTRCCFCVRNNKANNNENNNSSNSDRDVEEGGGNTGDSYHHGGGTSGWPPTASPRNHHHRRGRDGDCWYHDPSQQQQQQLQDEPSSMAASSLQPPAINTPPTPTRKTNRSHQQHPQHDVHHRSGGGGIGVLGGIGAFVDENGRIDGDNMCQVHKSALLLTVGLDEADLVYAQLKSSFRDNPYCILLDHRWKSVVVSVRGTFSIEDAVTDVLIEPESVYELGQAYGFSVTDDQYCHGGVLSTVHNVHRDLQRHCILDKLLLGDNAIYSDYTLRFVGHSLGAATSTILSFMLRNKFPTLRCINYSPPGCTLTWNMALQCKDWCTTFIVDNDLVPRLSLQSMEKLRDEVLEILGRIKISKINVAKCVMGGVVSSNSNSSSNRSSNDYDNNNSISNNEDHNDNDGCCCSSTWLGCLCSCKFCKEPDLDRDQDSVRRNLNEILDDSPTMQDSAYQRQLHRFRAIQEERKQARGLLRSVKLYPPGRIIHLTKTGERRSCIHGIVKCVTCGTTSYGSTYVPVWIQNDDLNEIVVSSTMGTDHFPNRVQSVLEQVATDFDLQT